MLRHVKHAHDDVPGVRHDEHRGEGLEYPLEEDERIEIVHVVAVNQHLDQFQAHDEGEDDTGDGDDDRFREAADHVEDAAIPAGRRHAHLAGDLAHPRIHGTTNRTKDQGNAHCTGDIRHLGIDAVKQPGKIADHAADQQLLEPLGNLVPDKIQRRIPP